MYVIKAIIILDNDGNRIVSKVDYGSACLVDLLLRWWLQTLVLYSICLPSQVISKHRLYYKNLFIRFIGN